MQLHFSSFRLRNATYFPHLTSKLISCFLENCSKWRGGGLTDAHVFPTPSSHSVPLAQESATGTGVEGLYCRRPIQCLASSEILTPPTPSPPGECVHHRVHRVATSAFWRTFHHEGKISPGWWGGGGVYAHPLSLYLPSPFWCGGRTHSLVGGEGVGGQ